jgi:type I restriction enzyme M protein
LPNNYGTSKDSLGTKLGELMDLIDNIKVEDADSKSQDVLGRVYEYFLGKFADAGGSGVASSLPHEVL